MLVLTPDRSFVNLCKPTVEHIWNNVLYAYDFTLHSECACHCAHCKGGSLVCICFQSNLPLLVGMHTSKALEHVSLVRRESLG